MMDYQAQCAYCGNIFLSKRKNVKYCSKQCADRYSHRTKRPRDGEQYNHIVELFQSGMNGRSIAKEIGVCEATVYRALAKAGIKRFTLKEAVKKYHDQGMCCAEIAQMLGKAPSTIRNAAIQAGVNFTEEDKKRSIQIGRERALKTQYGYSSESDRVAFEEDYIKQNHPGWTYISGYHNSDSFMELKCNCCGTVIKRSAITVRKKNIRCHICYNKEIELRKKQRELQKRREHEALIQKRSDAFWANFWKQEYKLPVIFKCEICGSIFVSHSTRAKYCSTECSKKAANRKSDKRIRRIRVKDRSISLERLFNRDNGICWICGGKCDYDDCHFDENKNFVVGNNYPSIDHVFPLSKGGNHTWENVRLAHHHCNTLKRDKVVW